MVFLFFSWRGPSFWRACPTQIFHALLFWDGLALPKYLGMNCGRRTMFGSLWCDLSVLVVFGVISVFWWFLVWFGQGWCFCGFCTKFMGFRKEFYVSVKTWFSSGWVFLVVAALGNSSFLNTFCMFYAVFPIPENWHDPVHKHSRSISFRIFNL